MCWVFLAAHGLSLAAASGGYSSQWCPSFSSGNVSCYGVQALGCLGFSSCGALGLELRLNSYGAWD